MIHHATPPDAVRFPKPCAQGTGDALSDGHKETAVEAAERLLGIDPTSTDLAWVRDQGGEFFATRSPEDSLCFPDNHPLSRQPRYRWLDRPGGVKLGYLIAGSGDA
jgi:hypothetical protein